MKYACRKTLADSRPRVRGRFARTLDDSGELLLKDGGGASLHDEDYDEVQNPRTILTSLIELSTKNQCMIRKISMAALPHEGVVEWQLQ
jgi:hypothetical protein